MKKTFLVLALVCASVFGITSQASACESKDSVGCQIKEIKVIAANKKDCKALGGTVLKADKKADSAKKEDCKKKCDKCEKNEKKK